MRDTVVVGASAGGIDAFIRLIRELPADFPAALLFGVHLSPEMPSVLAEIVSHNGHLKAISPEPGADGVKLTPGRIYVVRPDSHLGLEDEHVKAMRGPKVNAHRPSIDVLFRTAARSLGERVIGVVLSGMLDDGVGGLFEIRRRGGLAIVQNPDDARYPELPRNAISTAGADYVVPLAEMSALIVQLVKNSQEPGGKSPPGKKVSGQGGSSMIPRSGTEPLDWSSPAESPDHGIPSLYSCPECGGVLAKSEPDELPRFTCRVGHAYDPEALASEQKRASEDALWTALRALEERASFARKLEKRATALGQQSTGDRFREDAKESEQLARVIRAALSPDVVSANPVSGSLSSTKTGAR